MTAVAPPNHRRAPAPPGFTLLEVMLALMVFSIAVVALVGAINGTGVASTEARVTREVQSRLESLLTEFTRQPSKPGANDDRNFEKTVREGNVEYRIKRAPVELTNKDGQTLPEMFTLTLTARWKDGGRQDEMGAETLFYPPLYAPAP